MPLPDRVIDPIGSHIERDGPGPLPASSELLAATPRHTEYGATPRHRPARQPLAEDALPPALVAPEPDWSGYLD
jgi:hypothetical protein